MRAIRYHSPGGPEQLHLDEIDIPQVADGEVLVRVHAAGVNPIDAKIVQGQFPGARIPSVIGLDFAGIVESGAGFPKGTRVVGSGQGFGVKRDGAYAEYVVAPSECVVRLPDEIEFNTAAALGVVFTTAWMTVMDTAVVKSGEWVLVHGAGGAVGQACVQIAARVAHANVIAVVSNDASGVRAKELGAREVIDRTKHSFVDEAKRLTNGVGANVIVDVVGGEIFETSLGVLAPYGRLVSVGVSAGARKVVSFDLAQFYRDNRRFLGVNSAALGPAKRGEMLQHIVEQIQKGALSAPRVDVLPLAQAADAHRRLVAPEGTHGKIVLSV